jgi:hypothetical protein
MSALPIYVRNDAFTGAAARKPLGVRGALLRFSRPSVRPPSDAPVLGSREHFFHFLLGYLLPLVHAQTTNQDHKFLALDCGPLMTPILEETLKRLGLRFEIVPPGGMEKPFYLEAWDHHWTCTETVRAAADRVSTAWKDHVCAEPDCALSSNLLIERSPPHEYYRQGAAEIEGYGLSRRGITNWPEVCRLLNDRGIEHLLYEPGRHCLGCQVATFSAARRIVGIRGAEWANTIWSQPGLRVRVLDPDPPAHILTNFLKRTGVSCEFAFAPQHLASENPSEVARFFTTT